VGFPSPSQGFRLDGSSVFSVFLSVSFPCGVLYPLPLFWSDRGLFFHYAPSLYSVLTWRGFFFSTFSHRVSAPPLPSLSSSGLLCVAFPVVGTASCFDTRYCFLSSTWNRGAAHFFFPDLCFNYLLFRPEFWRFPPQFGRFSFFFFFSCPPFFLLFPLELGVLRQRFPFFSLYSTWWSDSIAFDALLSCDQSVFFIRRGF